MDRRRTSYKFRSSEADIQLSRSRPTTKISAKVDITSQTADNRRSSAVVRDTAPKEFRGRSITPKPDIEGLREIAEKRRKEVVKQREIEEESVRLAAIRDRELRDEKARLAAAREREATKELERLGREKAQLQREKEDAERKERDEAIEHAKAIEKLRQEKERMERERLDRQKEEIERNNRQKEIDRERETLARAREKQQQELAELQKEKLRRDLERNRLEQEIYESQKRYIESLKSYPEEISPKREEFVYSTRKESTRRHDSKKKQPKLIMRYEQSSDSGDRPNESSTLANSKYIIRYDARPPRDPSKDLKKPQLPEEYINKYSNESKWGPKSNKEDKEPQKQSQESSLAGDIRKKPVIRALLVYQTNSSFKVDDEYIKDKSSRSQEDRRGWKYRDSPGTKKSAKKKGTAEKSPSSYWFEKQDTGRLIESRDEESADDNSYLNPGRDSWASKNTGGRNDPSDDRRYPTKQTDQQSNIRAPPARQSTEQSAKADHKDKKLSKPHQQSRKEQVPSSKVSPTDNLRQNRAAKAHNPDFDLLADDGDELYDPLHDDEVGFSGANFSPDNFSRRRAGEAGTQKSNMTKNPQQPDGTTKSSNQRGNKNYKDPKQTFNLDDPGTTKSYTYNDKTQGAHRFKLPKKDEHFDEPTNQPEGLSPSTHNDVSPSLKHNSKEDDGTRRSSRWQNKPKGIPQLDSHQFEEQAYQEHSANKSRQGKSKKDTPESQKGAHVVFVSKSNNGSPTLSHKDQSRNNESLASKNRPSQRLPPNNVYENRRTSNSDNEFIKLQQGIDHLEEDEQRQKIKNITEKIIPTESDHYIDDGPSQEQDDFLANDLSQNNRSYFGHEKSERFETASQISKPSGVSRPNQDMKSIVTSQRKRLASIEHSSAEKKPSNPTGSNGKPAQTTPKGQNSRVVPFSNKIRSPLQKIAGSAKVKPTAKQPATTQAFEPKKDKSMTRNYTDTYLHPPEKPARALKKVGTEKSILSQGGNSKGEQTLPLPKLNIDNETKERKISLNTDDYEFTPLPHMKPNPDIRSDHRQSIRADIVDNDTSTALKNMMSPHFQVPIDPKRLTPMERSYNNDDDFPGNLREGSSDGELDLRDELPLQRPRLTSTGVNSHKRKSDYTREPIEEVLNDHTGDNTRARQTPQRSRDISRKRERSHMGDDDSISVPDVNRKPKVSLNNLMKKPSTRYSIGPEFMRQGSSTSKLSLSRCRNRRSKTSRT